ncbi:cyclase family protein [Alcaligenaceae bacterium]|nr:cyclase family protein [Alcaligenaceae bacterium]
MSNPRWKCRPPGSNWGDFGPNDQLGRLNLLTLEKVKQGVAEVKTGERFCLSLPLDLPGGNRLNPRRHAPRLQPVSDGENDYYNYPLCCEHPGATDLISDDCVVLYTQYSTQWDSLAHVGGLFDVDGDGTPQRVYYNGYRAGSHVVGETRPVNTADRQTVNAGALGVENMAVAAIQGRAVLVNLHKHYGDDRVEVDYALLKSVLAADRITVEPGDMLCLYTGFADRVVQMGGDPDPAVLHGACAVLDGRDPELRDWITSSGIAALIADNYAVERRPTTKQPPSDGAFMPLHELCLFKLGLPLGELWYLAELAGALESQGRSRFLLTAPPLRLPGAVGSPVTPVATI